MYIMGFRAWPIIFQTQAAYYQFHEEGTVIVFFQYLFLTHSLVSPLMSTGYYIEKELNSYLFNRWN